MHELLALGARTTSADGDGAQPLHLAARPWQHPAEIMQALLSVGAEVDAPDRQGRTPMHYAARWGNSPALRTLMGERSAASRPAPSHPCLPPPVSCWPQTLPTAKPIAWHAAPNASSLRLVLHSSLQRPAGTRRS